MTPVTMDPDDGGDSMSYVRPNSQQHQGDHDQYRVKILYVFFNF